MNARELAISAESLAGIELGLEAYAEALRDKTETYDAADIRRLTSDLRVLLAGYRALETENAAARTGLARCQSALAGVVNRYTRLIASGDCGFWDTETEPEIIAARAALASADTGADDGGA